MLSTCCWGLTPHQQAQAWISAADQNKKSGKSRYRLKTECLVWPTSPDFFGEAQEYLLSDLEEATPRGRALKLYLFLSLVAGPRMHLLPLMEVNLRLTQYLNIPALEGFRFVLPPMMRPIIGAYYGDVDPSMEA